jgi:hypothetical protein
VWLRYLLVISLSAFFFLCAVSIGFLFRLLLRFIKESPFISIWTGAPVINMAINARAEKLMGVKSYSIVNKTYFVTNDFDYILSSVSSNKWWLRIAPYFAFVAICIVAKRVHAYCDGGILPAYRRLSFNRFELLAYNALSIPVFLWTYGADVRTKEVTKLLGQPNCCTDCDQVEIACICNQLDWKKNFDFIEKFSKKIFSMGDMVEYTPNCEHGFYYWPVELSRENGNYYRPKFPENSGGVLRIVHAPNHRQYKGTKYLIQAVDVLKSQGFNIELILVEKVSNKVAITLYRDHADIVFDQCLVGFHGYFAVEAMALGKPVMCFIRDKQRYIYRSERSPIINTSVSSLVSDLKYWATDGRQYLHQIGVDSRKYVEEFCSTDIFSKNLEAEYRRLGVEI